MLLFSSRKFSLLNYFFLVSNLSVNFIYYFYRNRKDAITIFSGKGILPSERVCENDHKMQLYVERKKKMRCSISSFKKKENVCMANWFKISFLKALQLCIFMWLIYICALNKLLLSACIRWCKYWKKRFGHLIHN